MKKIFYLIIIVALILNGCMQNQSYDPIAQSEVSSKLNTENLILKDDDDIIGDKNNKIINNPYNYAYLDTLEYDYSLDMAKANDDVLWAINETYNFDRLDNFMSNVQDNIKDMLRVTSFTKEGDAIIVDLEFNGEFIKVSRDSKRDEYSANPAVNVYEYKDIVIHEEHSKDYSGTFINYYLTNNNSESELMIAQIFNPDK